MGAASLLHTLADDSILWRKYAGSSDRKLCIYSPDPVLVHKFWLLTHILLNSLCSQWVSILWIYQKSSTLPKKFDTEKAGMLDLKHTPLRETGQDRTELQEGSIAQLSQLAGLHQLFINRHVQLIAIGSALYEGGPAGLLLIVII